MSDNNTLVKFSIITFDLPIITINWKSVKLSLKSFDVNAITKRDIAHAREIEKKLKGNNKNER